MLTHSSGILFALLRAHSQKGTLAFQRECLLFQE